ncbi:MAG: sugar ABC transporter ATP-binding protein [Rhizobiales bacterium]|nr:sugar ABC transporter ATP-binding protein [Hyphomicrobiales bacterium]MBO6698810.1 sugar ABC transporter ATP-binding protein [Hyphomicrobiales bacterium]MBO6734937.1 sugar ABC transporter ATP-binding protein [Hyphomicrobiales bacterium]MBO6911257.1 sugar ABC transporter ATP-binding protein [Hyphomicrobiales bacterium]MBO6955739.1 sugar ABC transporter ATP-binding protein [Hyphomicrobiales bacterium]
MTEPVLSLDHVSKRFGSTLALSDMSLALFPGEVHAIVGENGAGKSTMIKTMTGIHQPSDGSVSVDGATRTISSSQTARELGIAAIYQEPMVFPDLDVAENIFISQVGGGWLQNKAKQRKDARALIERIGMDLDVDRAASGLTLAEQQAVEIARALSQDVRILIMDEPTASLSAHEAEQLRRIARQLAADGVAVVYISHRLEEIFEVADRVTVIRDGEHISTRLIGETDTDTMIAEMVGREVGNYFAKGENHAREEVILAVNDLSLDGVFEGIHFDLKRGEVLAMAGLIGARRTDVALALFGIQPATSGTVAYKGETLHITSPKQAMDAGIAYVSEDRRKLGLAMPMAIRANISLATLGDFLSKIGLINRTKEAETAHHFRERLNIRTPDIETEVGMLSGGNQQKVMLAKWLNMGPDLLIFDEPTRGIDVGAKAEVHELIRNFVKEGGAAIVISSDLPEVLAMGDRVLVMREGEQMAILDHAEANQERIMALATGQSETEKAA